MNGAVPAARFVRPISHLGFDAVGPLRAVSRFYEVRLDRIAGRFVSAPGTSLVRSLDPFRRLPRSHERCRLGLTGDALNEVFPPVPAPADGKGGGVGEFRLSARPAVPPSRRPLFGREAAR